MSKKVGVLGAVWSPEGSGSRRAGVMRLNRCSDAPWRSWLQGEVGSSLGPRGATSCVGRETPVAAVMVWRL